MNRHRSLSSELLSQTWKEELRICRDMSDTAAFLGSYVKGHSSMCTQPEMTMNGDQCLTMKKVKMKKIVYSEAEACSSNT